jgi:hypothetical protein
MHGFSKEFPLPGAVSIGNSQFIEPNLSDSVLQYPGSLGSYDRAKVEVSVVQCPSYLHHGFMELFSGVDVKKGNLCIVIFSECTENDMSSWSTAVEEEREELTKHFIEISKEVCSKLLAGGYWADFIDPSCGRAVRFFSHLSGYYQLHAIFISFIAHTPIIYSWKLMIDSAFLDSML